MSLMNDVRSGQLNAACLVGLGHGATHWVAAVFYFCTPFLAKELGLSFTQAGALATAFHVASFLANLGSGPVVDMTGKRVLWQVVSLVIGAVALLGFAQGMSYGWVLLAVIFIGASNNLWHPAAISYLSLRYPERRGFALSLHALGANLGDAVAPLILGVVIVSLGWREASSLSILVPILLAGLLFVTLKRTKGGSITRSEENSQQEKQSYLSGLKSLLQNRAVLIMCLMSGFRNLAQAGLLFFLPLYLLNDLGLGEAASGGALFAFQAAGLLAAPLAGHLSDVIGRRQVVMSGLTATTLLLIGLTFVENSLIYVAGISIMGFALFAIRPVVHSWLMDITPDHMGGSATSVMFGVQSLLAMIAPTAGGWLADLYGLQAAFYFLGAGMLVANLLVLGLPKNIRTD